MKKYESIKKSQCLEGKNKEVTLYEGIYEILDGNEKNKVAGVRHFKECSLCMSNRCGSLTCPYRN